MHGIERTRNWKNPDKGGGVKRITVRYSDGRILNFMPDAGREAFSEDDILELKNLFERASSAAEWSEVTARSGTGD